MAKYGQISGQGRMDFTAILVNYHFRLSEQSFIGYNIEKLVDFHWRKLTPYMDEIDIDMYDSLVERRQDNYNRSLNKVRCIALFLDRHGIIASSNSIDHRFFGRWLGQPEVHSSTSIDYETVLIRHDILTGFLLKKFMPIMNHMDVMWMLLSPYVTMEDMASWKHIHSSTLNSSSPFYDSYMGGMDKCELCSRVMDRAGFELSRARVDRRGKDSLRKPWTIDRKRGVQFE